jgi:ubiquinone/menaquinone biosynthesis C-methylase UbiE
MQHEHAENSASYPIEADNIAEMNRLIKQAEVMTDCLGLVPDALDLSQVQTILDVACGPGEWVVGMAKQLPQADIVGIDISPLMIDHAQVWASSQSLSKTQFRVMDARGPLAFPDASFDLIHARFLVAFLTQTTWRTLLAECFRLLRPGGILCCTEAENIGITTSLAFTQFNSLLIESFRRQGHCFTRAGDNSGLTVARKRLLQEAGFSEVSQYIQTIDFSHDSPVHPAFLENYSSMLILTRPLFQQTLGLKEEELQTLAEEVADEMQDPSFQAISYFQTLLGRRG